MNFNLFIKELQQVDGLGNLHPDKRGNYSLRINQHHLIYFSQSSDSHDFYLYAPIGHFPFDPERKLELMERLLKANAFGSETGHAFFAFDHLHNNIILTIRIAMQSLSKEKFITELEPFISCLVHWKKILDELPHFQTKKNDLKENFIHLRI